MERIDAHHHLWRYDPGQYSWIDDTMEPLRQDFLLKDLQPLLAAAAVRGTVAVQARQTVEETDWLLDLARESNVLEGVVGWLPIADGGFEAQLERYAGQPRLKGLRHVVQAEQAGFLDDASFNRGMQQITRSGLTYDLLIVAAQLEESLRFVGRHPDQPFVIDHIAKPAIGSDGLVPWAAQMRRFAGMPNVACKISGMVTETGGQPWTPQQLKPYFDVVLETFGPDRLMIGTDWPVLTLQCSYGQWWATVEEWIAPLTSTEREAISWRTATRFYRLGAA